MFVHFTCSDPTDVSSCSANADTAAACSTWGNKLLELLHEMNLEWLANLFDPAILSTKLEMHLTRRANGGKLPVCMRPSDRSCIDPDPNPAAASVNPHPIFHLIYWLTNKIIGMVPFESTRATLRKKVDEMLRDAIKLQEQKQHLDDVYTQDGQDAKQNAQATAQAAPAVVPTRAPAAAPVPVWKQAVSNVQGFLKKHKLWRAPVGDYQLRSKPQGRGPRFAQTLTVQQREAHITQLAHELSATLMTLKEIMLARSKQHTTRSSPAMLQP